MDFSREQYGGPARSNGQQLKKSPARRKNAAEGHKTRGENEPNAKDKDELDNWNLKINLFPHHNTMNFF